MKRICYLWTLRMAAVINIDAFTTKRDLSLQASSILTAAADISILIDGLDAASLRHEAPHSSCEDSDCVSKDVN